MFFLTEILFTIIYINVYNVGISKNIKAVKNFM